MRLQIGMKNIIPEQFTAIGSPSFIRGRRGRAGRGAKKGGTIPEASA